MSMAMSPAKSYTPGPLPSLPPSPSSLVEACVHPFFDELRHLNTRLPNGRPLPPMFNFKPQAIDFSHRA